MFAIRRKDLYLKTFRIGQCRIFQRGNQLVPSEHCGVFPASGRIVPIAVGYEGIFYQQKMSLHHHIDRELRSEAAIF